MAEVFGWVGPVWGDAHKWLESNWGNILAGIVASIVVLLLQGVGRAASLALAEFITLKWQLRRLWGLRSPQRVYIVSGAVTNAGDSLQSVMLAGPDAEAASTLVATAGLLYPSSEIRHVYSSTFGRDMYKEHLVVVGGPVYNSCTAAFLKQLGDPLSFNENMELIVSGSTFATSYDSNDIPLKDYGAIVRAENPYDRSKDVVVIVGCDTYGVLAASIVVSTRADGKRCRGQLQKKLGLMRFFRRENYVAAVECDVLDNDIGQVRLGHFHRTAGIA